MTKFPLRRMSPIDNHCSTAKLYTKFSILFNSFPPIFSWLSYLEFASTTPLTGLLLRSLVTAWLLSSVFNVWSRLCSSQRLTDLIIPSFLKHCLHLDNRTPLSPDFHILSQAAPSHFLSNLWSWWSGLRFWASFLSPLLLVVLAQSYRFRYHLCIHAS